MRSRKRWWPQAPIVIAAAVAVAVCAVPADATTLMRASLADLTAANSTIVIGDVLDIHSYWNEDASFILTDVKVRVGETMKAEGSPEAVTITLLGGTVGEISTLVLGVPSLEIDKSYLFFLNEEQLPGGQRHLTVRDHCQGAFDILAIDGELRARSQAWDFGLVPDELGSSQPPGGEEGLKLESILETISGLVAQAAGEGRS